MPDYYNTNQETGETLQASKAQARSQQDRVLAFFRESPDVPIPPHTVWEREFNMVIPLTSVRRAITNLTLEGKLVKTPMRFPGTMGKMVFGWKLNGNSHDLRP